MNNPMSTLMKIIKLFAIIFSLLIMSMMEMSSSDTEGSLPNTGPTIAGENPQETHRSGNNYSYNTDTPNNEGEEDVSSKRRLSENSDEDIPAGAVGQGETPNPNVGTTTTEETTSEETTTEETTSEETTTEETTSEETTTEETTSEETTSEGTPTPEATQPTPKPEATQAPKASPTKEPTQSSAPKGEKPDGETKKVKLTYYWTFNPKDEKVEIGADSHDVPLLDQNNKEITEVPIEIAKRYGMEGSGILEDGRVINLANDGGEDVAQARFMVLDKKTSPWGLGKEKPLNIFKTIAANDIPQGTKVYIPILDGLEMPDGSTHDGYTIVEDVSWSFGGSQVDFFAGKYQYYQAIAKATNVDDEETEVIICK